VHNAKSLKITWTRFEKDCRTLALSIKKAGKWEALAAVTRGGLIPAAIVAQELGIRHIDTICISSYRNRKKIPLIVHKRKVSVSRRLLIIDDLVDTGDTARLIKSLFPDAFYAVVYAKPSGIGLVDCFTTRIRQDRWVIFPWDKR
jgi:xanthine phosphoribosyltransferase